MRSAIIGIVFAGLIAFGATGSAQAEKPLTNQDVIEMVKAGLPESTILLSVKQSQVAFATGPQDLIALKKAGVTQPVMDAMLTRGSGAPASASAAAPAAVPGMPPGGYPGMMGPQGIVAIDGDSRVELIQTLQMAGKNKMRLWSNEHIVILPGDKAKTRLTSRSATFEVPVMPGIDPEQTIRLMKMTIRGDTREVALRVNSYDRLLRRVPKVTDGVIETTLEPVAQAQANSYQKTYLLAPKNPLEPGEYAIIQYDSQIYPFGID